MIVTCSECGHVFKAKQAPCPKGIEGCCVSHWDLKSFKCLCGNNMGPTIGKAFLEGRVIFEEGLSIINSAAISKLELEIQ
jgi:hypothetical protein